jgi:DNA-binding CsgD family transcriptional regulator
MASGAMRGDAVLGSGALGLPRLWSGRSDRWRVAGACLLIAATAAFSVPAYNDMKPLYEAVLGGPLAPTYALLGAAPALVLVAAGLLAWWSHPASRIGVLLILEGVTWNLGTLVYSAAYIPGGTELAAVATYVSYAIGGHILLSYPSGRLRDSRDRMLAGLLYLGFGPAIIVCFAFHGAYGPGCPLSPANAFLITPNDSLDIAFNGAWFAVTGVLMAVTGLRSVPRWRTATPVARRSLAPVYVTRWMLAGSVTLWCAVGAGVVFADVTKPNMALQIPLNLAAMAAAAGILVVFLRSAVAGSAAGRLALDLDAAPLPAGRLEQAVRSALGDPDARLLFRDHAGTSWVDSQGVAVTPEQGRSITPFDGMSGSALEHDAAFDDDPAVVEAVGAVAGLALEAERLRVLLRAAGNGDRARADGAPALRSLLTAREREVLALVAEGLTDGAIAQRLFLTRRTVETHLGHVFAKLGVPAGSSQNRRVHAVRRYLDAAELGAKETLS